MPIQVCLVSFTDHHQIRHIAEVLAESVYEAVVLAMRVFRQDPWVDSIGPGTVLEVEARAPWVRHSISLAQVERWLGGATLSPNEKAKKTQLKAMLVKV
jgi:hypothetical protein